MPVLARTLMLASCLGAAVFPQRAVAVEEEPLPFPSMAPSIGELLSRYYYDPSRFRPVVMVERALRALENAEIGIEAAWIDDQIRLNIGGDITLVPAAKPADLGAAMKLIETLRLTLDRPEFDATTQRDFAYSLLNGALLSLDPHSLILPPAPASEFTEDINGQFFGVGAFLNQENGIIRIDRVMPGLPADLAGVRDGDIILAVDGEKTVGLSLEQAVRRIKGPKGTKVVLTVEHVGEEKPVDIPIIRDLIPVPTLVSYRSDDIGYVRMDEFNRNSARQLFTAIMSLQQAGPMRGFVLDLRFNGGGLLKQAHIISDFFLGNNKEVVRTVAKGREPQIQLSGRRTLLDVPMMVMVGAGSASAAEILSGALQTNDRAVVVGETTYGKGSVQTVRELRDESNIKLTIQEYQLKDGLSIQERGVQPDVNLRRHSVAADGSVDLIPYSFRREKDQEFALHAAKILEHETSLDLTWVREYESDDEQKTHRVGAADFAPDQEASLVIEMFTAALAVDGADAQIEAGQLADSLRQVTIELLRPAVADRAVSEADDLAQALAAAQPGFEWGDMQEAAAGSLLLAYAGPKSVVAGSTAELSFTVTNKGDVALGRLYGLVAADPLSPLWEDEVVIGQVTATGDKTVSIQFEVPERMYTGNERFTFNLYQMGNKEPVASLPVELHVESQPRPHFSYQWTVLDGAVDQPSALTLDNPVRLQLTVENTGSGASKPTMVYVFKDDDPFVQLGEGRFRIDALQPGTATTISVPVTVSSTPPPGAVRQKPYDKVTLQIRAEEDFPATDDARYRESLFHVLTLPVADLGAAPIAGARIQKPRLTIQNVTKTNAQAELVVRVQDDNPRYLAVFVGDDKTHLYALDDKQTDTAITIPLSLKDGLNDVRLIATDRDDVSDAVPLRIWDKPIELADVQPAAEGVAR